MDLRQIRYFVATSEAGSMLAAAERLRLAQPALSRRLRDLEAALGVRLLERHSRGIRLTSEGTRFLAHARDILDAVARAQSAFTPHNDDDGAIRLAFGVTPTPAALLMSRIVVACRTQVPAIELLVRQGSTPELQDLVARHAIDGCLTYARAGGPALDVHPLYREDLLLVGRPGVVPAGDEIAFAALADVPLILDPRTHITRAVIDAAAARTGTRLDVRAEIEPLPIKRDILDAQAVATITIAGTFAKDVAAGALVARRIVAPALPMVLNLVLQRSIPAPAREMFRQIVQSAVADVIATGRLGWRRIDAEP